LSGTAIRVQGIGKKYRLGESRAAYETLRDTIAGAWGQGRSATNPTREIWALRDVSFEVRPGEAVGIIGRNGAGKSTLLKILSRITEPTEGYAEIHGRVGSLLEVGTGFHPELTGRENIFLSGAILGMKRTEIRRQFDAIVAFAQIERFLDTPVKRYSSGMFVRLAFAVAAHLTPEILLVDEVLAVGDLEFQKKCIGKMDDVAHEGRTVLFVSHSMGTIERLCGRCVLLADGRVEMTGPTPDVVRAYVRSGGSQRLQWRREGSPPSHPHILRVAVTDKGGTALDSVTSASVVGILVACAIPQARPALQLGVCVYDGRGEAVFSTGPRDDGKPYPTRAGIHEYVVMFPGAILMPQRYTVTASLYDPGGGVDQVVGAIVLDVTPVASLANLVDGGRPGVLQLACSWTHAFSPAGDPHVPAASGVRKTDG
jgi:lipopolysaccharide transport system ATP-binding protein